MGFAREMENQAIDLASAAKAKNYDQARAAAGKIAQACNNCHGGFRN
jgi:cytochrome c556